MMFKSWHDVDMKEFYNDFTDFQDFVYKMKENEMTNKTITIEVPEGADVLINGKRYNDGGGLWKPEYGDEYWVYLYNSSVRTYHWADDDTDKELYSRGHCFPTKEAVQAHVRNLKTMQRMREIAAEGPAIDWGDEDQDKFHVYYDYEDDLIGITAVYSCRRQGTIYFPAKELAQKVIDELGDDLVKLIKGED